MAVDRLYGKDAGGTWRRAKPAYVKVAGSWQRVKTVWVKVAGSWTQVFGEAVSLTASGTVLGVNSWTFNYSIYANAGNTVDGGGVGCDVVLKTSPGGITYATYSDVGGTGNSEPVDVDETSAYTAELYDKAGTLVDSVTFTPA